MEVHRLPIGGDNSGYGIYYEHKAIKVFRPSFVILCAIASGDSIGFRVRRERSCELFVNGESKGVICDNLPAMIVPAITPSLSKRDLNVCSVCCVNYDA